MNVGANGAGAEESRGQRPNGAEMRHSVLAGLLLAAAAGPLRAEGPVTAIPPPARLQHLFPGAQQFGVESGMPPAIEVRREGAAVGYIFSTRKVVESRGYSGKPFDIWVGLDRGGRITGAWLADHREPILIVGIPTSTLEAYVERFRGVDIRNVVRVGRARGAGEIGFDAISGATASSTVIADTILRAARIVARSRGIFGVSALPSLDLDAYEPLDWAALLEIGALAQLKVSGADVNERLGPGSAPPDSVFVELYAGLATPALAGRNLLGDRLYESHSAALPPGGQLVFVAGRGLYSFKGTAWLRSGEFERIRIVQGMRTIAFAKGQHHLVEGLRAKGAPDFRELAVFALPPDAGLDPARPWRLELAVEPLQGVRSAEARFALEYRPPQRLVRTPAAAPDPVPQAPPLWQQAWEDRVPALAGLGLMLAALTGVLFLQDPIARRPTLYRPLRIAFLGLTLVWLGWFAGAQLSVVNVITFAQSLLTGFHWEDFLLEPMIFVLWAFVAVTMLFWGRGVYCGWLCPFGALQELLNKLAIALKVSQLKIPFGLHERLWPIKYVIFLALFAVSLGSMTYAFIGAEVEPFKTTISLRFLRDWPFVAYAAALLVTGLFVERFFCRYLCPLGAALAIPARLRMFDWLKRRHQCGAVCQACATKCTVQAIHPDGRINPNECVHCLECQVLYHDDGTCPPLIERRKRRERRAALASRSMAGSSASATPP
jgi:transcriptional regulator of nitric oxide reductase